MTDTGKLIVWSLVGSAIVVIIAGFVLAWLLQRMVTRPVAGLAVERAPGRRRRLQRARST